MFGWFSKPKPIDQVSIDIANARALLPKLRLQLDKAGIPALPDAQGVAEVAQALAYAYDLPVTDVLVARVTAEQAAAICRDIDAAQARCSEYLSSTNAEARALAEALVAGCTVFSHLYRMRLHHLQGPEERRAEAGEMASGFADIAQALLRAS